MGGGSGAETVNPPPSWDLAVLWHKTNLPQSSPRSRREEERFPGGLAPKRSLRSREGSEFWDVAAGRHQQRRPHRQQLRVNGCRPAGTCKHSVLRLLPTFWVR